jgi:hypothetical protein
VLRTAVFWVATIALVGYVVWSYLRDHPEIVEALKRLQITAALRALLAQLRRQARAAISAIREMSSENAGGRDDGGGQFRGVRLSARSPRERVLFYYLSTLRRAARAGIPRVQDQTPREYGSVLGPRLPEAHADLASLTDHFVEAKYSHHEITREREKRARVEWRTVRRALAALRRAADSAPER